MFVNNKKLFCIILILFTGIVLLFSKESQYYLHILSLLILVLYACFSVDFDIYHPLCAFSIFYLMYSCAYVVLQQGGVVTDYGYLKETLILDWVGLSVLLLILPVRKVDISKIEIKYDGDQIRFIKVLNYILSFFVILGAVYIVLRGFSGKSEIYESGGLFINFVLKVAYICIILYTYVLYVYLANKVRVSKLWIFVSFGSVVLIGAISGERDYIFAIGFITLLLLSVTKTIPKRHLILMMIAGLILLPFSRSYKYFLLRGTASRTITWNNLIYEILDGEFISAGRNLQLVVSNNYSGHFGGRLLFYDIANVFFNTGVSSNKWFHDTFFYGIKTGYGFGLVAEGFINGGYLGVIIEFVCVALLLRMLYLHSIKNAYFMMAYIYMLPLFIYSIRSNLTSILSPLCKYVVFGIVIIYFAKKIRIGNYYWNDERIQNSEEKPT